MDPHTRASALAQDHVRDWHPRLTASPGDGANADHVLRHWLGAAGHPGADDAYVVKHSDPARPSSHTGRGPDGEPAVILHHQRYDYGTMAHETAHLIVDHETGRPVNGPPAEPEGVHGPRWAAHYTRLLNGISKGAGDDYDSERQQHLDADPASRRTAATRPVEPYVLYHGAHHDDVDSIMHRGLERRNDQPTVTDSREGASLYGHSRDWTAPKVLEIHVPRDQADHYLGEPQQGTGIEGNVRALKATLPPRFIHQVHEAAARPAEPSSRPVRGRISLDELNRMQSADAGGYGDPAEAKTVAQINAFQPRRPELEQHMADHGQQSPVVIDQYHEHGQHRERLWNGHGRVQSAGHLGWDSLEYRVRSGQDEPEDDDEGWTPHTAAATPAFYHGTRHPMKPGLIMTPQHIRGSMAEHGDHVYFHTDPHMADWYGEASEGPDDDHHVYQVEPVGHHEQDPEPFSEEDPRPDPGSFRAPRARVIREVHLPHEAAVRPDRGSESCGCCSGNGTHGDGSKCSRCEGTGSVPRRSREPNCPDQPSPQRRHWRESAVAGFKHDESPWFHGTRHEFQPGQVLEGGKFKSNQGYGQPGDHVYYSMHRDIAATFAHAGYGTEDHPDAKPRVYEVEPDPGSHEPDPDEAESAGSYRAKNVRVVREVPWRRAWGKRASAAPAVAARKPHPGPWYHGTNEDLAPGDHVQTAAQVGRATRGGEGDEHRAWVSSDPVKAGAYGARIYEVSPHDAPVHTRGPADEHNTSGATVVREVPYHEARQLSPSYQEGARAYERQQATAAAEPEPDHPWVTHLNGDQHFYHVTRRPGPVTELPPSAAGESGPGVYLARDKAYADKMTGWGKEQGMRALDVTVHAGDGMRLLDRTKPGGEEAYRQHQQNASIGHPLSKGHGAQEGLDRELGEHGYHGVRYRSPGNEHAETVIHDPSRLTVSEPSEHTAALEPHEPEQPPGPLYHGTRSILHPGDHLTPEGAAEHANNPDIHLDPYVHATHIPSEAHEWGERSNSSQASRRMRELGREQRVRDGQNTDHAYPPRVYRVEPTGPVEKDRAYEDTEPNSWRSAHPMRVAEEVHPLECYHEDHPGEEHWPDHEHYSFLKAEQDEQDDDEDDRWGEHEGALEAEAAEDTSYRGWHQAPGGPDDDVAAPMHDAEGVMPQVYDRPELYRHPGIDNSETVRQMRRARGNPEADVTIYRSQPHGRQGINKGDWVTPSAAYARLHSQSNTEGGGEQPVVKATVKAKHLFSEGYTHEWGYHGPDIEHAEVHHPGRTAALEATAADAGHLTLYHGTSQEDAESIARDGMRPPPEHIRTPRWVTTTVNRQTSDAYASRGPGNRATVELHIPHDKVDEHLWPAQDHMGGDAYSPKKHIPPEWVHAVHPVHGHVDYPDDTPAQKTAAIPAAPHQEAVQALASWQPQSRAELSEALEDLPGFFRACGRGMDRLGDRVMDMPVDEAVPDVFFGAAGLCRTAAGEAEDFVAHFRSATEGT